MPQEYAKNWSNYDSERSFLEVGYNVYCVCVCVHCTLKAGMFCKHFKEFWAVSSFVTGPRSWNSVYVCKTILKLVQQFVNKWFIYTDICAVLNEWG